MGKQRKPRVEVLADQYVDWCRRWERRLRRWPRTWEQIEGTASSLVANLGEAFDSVTMPQRRKYFGYAKASVGEALRLVTAAGRAGLVPPAAVYEARRLLTDVRWDLVRLIQWTHRPPPSGGATRTK